MGIKRGNFESAGLGALAKSVNPTYHQHNSVASGLGALASGLKTYAESWGAVTEGMKTWGKFFFTLGDDAAKADAQQKENERMAGQAAEEFAEGVEIDGLTENDEKYWKLHDEVVRWRYRATHQGLFGVYSAPQLTMEVKKNDDGSWTFSEMSDERKKTRRAALGITEEKRSYGFGGISAWDGEEN